MNDFNTIWEIYENSFPEDERRSLDKQKKLLSNPRYSFNPIYDKNKIVAFTAIWNLPNFIFIEHFAIKKEFRGKGYGTKILKNIIEKYDKKVILEVEKPETHDAKRRIDFYKNLGFFLNKYDYKQPPLGENKQPVPLFLMSYPIEISPEEFINIREVLYEKVYKE